MLSPGLLTDMHGNVIPDGELRKEAAAKLEEYIYKNKSLFEHWFIENGTFSKPPVMYDLNTKEWIWTGEGR